MKSKSEIKRTKIQGGCVFKGGKECPGLYLIICPKCERENWAMVVAKGQCCWCGYQAKESDVRG